MAAYGALVSLMHIIDRLEKHPSPPVSIDKQQVESLIEIVTFLQDFLDAYISPVVDDPEADPLERRIADAVYAAEDVIESQIVLQIDNRSTIRGKISSFINLFRALCKCATIEDDFYHDLQQVIEEMNLIKKEALEIAAAAQLQRKVSSTHAGSTTSSSTMKESMMVGFDELLLEVLDKLTGGQLSRQIIPIMGMGGIGKTTLARHVFEHALVKVRFHICAWTTISQTYNVRDTLREVLFQASGDPDCDLSENQLGQKSLISEDELGLKLYQYLWGRRYLIIMDDMWSIEVWDKFRSFFPDYNDGSRIIVTTRMSNLISQLGESYGIGMKFLDEASSWDLFTKTVFGAESFPRELENIGKNIVANCKGLPLSIATIGGLLAKSACTREYWVRIEQNLNSIVITNNDEFCLKILRMSYIYLPNYLKPCFLYMGVFEEDRRIRASMLKKLWVSEGFLKPMSTSKCLETIAQEYLKELADRNLIIVDKLGCIGNVKYCKIHDLLRDMCLKEVEKERFYHIIEKSPSVIDNERRVVFKNAGSSVIREVSRSLSHARSIICDEEGINFERPQHFRLLRTFKEYDRDTDRRDKTIEGGIHFLGDVFQLVNSRHIAVRLHWKSKFPSSINLLWNLYTLIVYRSLDTSWDMNRCGDCRWPDLIAPIDIWKLHQLRHLEFVDAGLILPDPPSELVIMENLQTLRGAKNLNLNEEVVQRIPNVKKLHLIYQLEDVEACLIKSSLSKLKQRAKCLSYLECLCKLENLYCRIYFEYDEYLRRISFPHSLKKLKLTFIYCFHVELVEILEKIGWLPLLQKLVLQYGTFKTGKWDTIEGQFRSLKLLQLDWCSGLKNWTMAESSHFPLLQELCLRDLEELEEIPLEVGEIPTPKSIRLKYCSESAVVSAKKIVEEQEDLYGDQLELHVRVLLQNRNERLQRLASPNFEVRVAAGY